MRNNDDDEQRERQREYARRDDQARLRELQDEIDAAEKTIAKLEADHDEPSSKAGTAGSRALKRAGYDPSAAEKWLGAPSVLRLTRRFDGKLEHERFEQIVERVREITHEPGIVEIRDTSVVWGSSTERHPSQAHLMVRVTVEPDGSCTNLVVTDRLGALVGRLFGAFGTIIGAGGLTAPVAASLAFPWLTPVFVFGWLGGVFGTTRLLYRRLAASRAKQLQEVFGALVLEIDPYIKPPKKPT